MGHLALRDLLLSKLKVEHFDVFSMEEIDTAFDRITPLKYRQPLSLHGAV